MKLVAVGSTDKKTVSRLTDQSKLSRQLNAGFRVYTALMSDALKQNGAVSPAVADAVLEEMHARLLTYWKMNFTPNIQAGMKVRGGQLDDKFLRAAAGKYSGELASQINTVSNKAFKEGLQAATHKGWSKAQAWERIANAWGLDTQQMRAWVTAYPEEATGYITESLPETAKRMLDDFLGIRGERIGEHESRTILNLGEQANWSKLVEEGKVSKYAVKTFVTAEDELVCPECGPLNGISVPLSSTFSGFYMPPLHINCRCDVTVSFDTEKLEKSQPIAIKEEEIDIFDAPKATPQKIGKPRYATSYNRGRSNYWATKQAKQAKTPTTPSVAKPKEAPKAEVQAKPAPSIPTSKKDMWAAGTKIASSMAETGRAEKAFQAKQTKAKKKSAARLARIHNEIAEADNKATYSLAYENAQKPRLRNVESDPQGVIHTGGPVKPSPGETRYQAGRRRQADAIKAAQTAKKRLKNSPQGTRLEGTASNDFRFEREAPKEIKVGSSHLSAGKKREAVSGEIKSLEDAADKWLKGS